MTPAAAKLLMCVCAGSTGAAIVPAVHKARAALHRPAAQHASAFNAAPGNAMSSPCAPVASAAPLLAPIGAMPAQAGLGALGQLAENSPAGANSFGFGFPGGGLADAGEGGYIGGGGIGGGGPIGGGPIGGNPGTGPGGTPPTGPVTGTVPEPASWALLLIGFGTMGGAIRWQRRAVA